LVGTERHLSESNGLPVGEEGGQVHFDRVGVVATLASSEDVMETNEHQTIFLELDSLEVNVGGERAGERTEL